MAKSLRSLPADPKKWTIEQLAEVNWEPDNGRTPALLEVPEVLELGTQVVRARRVDPAQLGLGFDSPDTWPSYPHLKQLWQVME